MSTPPLTSLLQDHHADLVSYLRRHAGLVLRFETPDDLVQGLHLRALERGGEFRYEGLEPFRGWIYTVARTYLVDRKAHWSALKRNSAGLLRLTSSGTESDGVGEPAAAITGPSTFASRAELMAVAVKALAVLRPRDRRLVRWTAEDMPLEEQASRLSISYTAARQARARAVERFRKAFRLATGS